MKRLIFLTRSAVELKEPAWTASEPSSDLWMLMGCVVVDDEMDVELVRHIVLDVAQEGEELLMTMTGFALGDDRAVEHVEGSEQSGGAVALVVVGDAFDITKPQGKHGLGAFESLFSSTQSTTALSGGLR